MFKLAKALLNAYANFSTPNKLGLGLFLRARGRFFSDNFKYLHILLLIRLQFTYFSPGFMNKQTHFCTVLFLCLINIFK